MPGKERAATIGVAQEPTAAILAEDLIGVMALPVRESQFQFGHAALRPTTQLMLGHGGQPLEQLERTAAGDYQRLIVTTDFAELDDLLCGRPTARPANRHRIPARSGTQPPGADVAAVRVMLHLPCGGPDHARQWTQAKFVTWPMGDRFKRIMKVD